MNGRSTSEDTLAGIFDILYLCRIPVTATKTIEQIRQFGMYSTGDKFLDKAQSRALTTTYLSIEKMAEIHASGAEVRLVKYTDVKPIYEAVTKHLIVWKNQLDSGVNLGTAPIEDLISLDQFAVDLYEHVKYEQGQAGIDSLNIQYLNSIIPFNRNTFFSSTPSVTIDGKLTTPEEKQYPERDSFSNFFRSKLQKSNVWN
jgi:hypothetical protein